MIRIQLAAALAGLVAVACSGANEDDEADAAGGGSDASVADAPPTPMPDADPMQPDAAPPPRVVINEVFAAGNPAHPADFQFDWVELKNLESTPVDLTGWHLTDNPSNLTKGTFPAGSTVAAGGYLVVQLEDGAGNFEFGLKQDGTEPLLLADPALTVADQTTFAAGAAGADPPAAPASWARSPDGTGAFATDATPTRNAAND